MRHSRNGTNAEVFPTICRSETRPENRESPGFTWRQIVPLTIAALAMVATLPGRTHGLGLITEPMLTDLNISRVDYANINLWATLIGATFCIPCGWLLDRLGTRLTLSATCVILGLVVTGMTLISPGSVAMLFGLVLLTRGLGQSALSVVSLTIMGKTVGKKSSVGVAVYSVLCTIGFIAAFMSIKAWETATGEIINPGEHWRTLWGTIGYSVLGFGLIGWIPRQSSGAAATQSNRVPESPSTNGQPADTQSEGLTLWQALRTQTFWSFALATSFYGMVAAGISLFNQAILEERGFDRSLFLTITAIGPLVGLVANLSTGAAAIKVPLERLLAVAMLLIAAALLCFPFVQTYAQVYAYAVTLAIGGGMITVLFFAVWSKYFGEAHLGKIQGAAQMLTVFASAVGPLLVALSQEWTGFYTALYQSTGVISLGLAGWACFLSPPKAAIKLSAESLHDAGEPSPSHDMESGESHDNHVIRTD
ncbi:MAG: MFS transporter [Gemmataceae bacterium]